MDASLHGPDSAGPLRCGQALPGRWLERPALSTIAAMDARHWMKSAIGAGRPDASAWAAWLSLALLLILSQAARAQPAEVDFPTADGGTIVANLYGAGSSAVVLAHGAVFDKESWHELAERLADEGLTVLAIDFRGYGRSRAGSSGRGALHEDVLAGIRYLAARGAREVSVLGASMGGGAVGEAAAHAVDDEIEHLILLAAVAYPEPERMTGTKLFIVSEGDSFRRSVEAQFRRAAGPKRLEVLPGNAHAQHVFRTATGDALTELIVAELTN